MLRDDDGDAVPFFGGVVEGPRFYIDLLRHAPY